MTPEELSTTLGDRLSAVYGEEYGADYMPHVTFEEVVIDIMNLLRKGTDEERAVFTEAIRPEGLMGWTIAAKPGYQLLTDEEAEQMLQDFARLRNAARAERALAIALTEALAADTDDDKWQAMMDKHKEWKRFYIEGEA